MSVAIFDAEKGSFVTIGGHAVFIPDKSAGAGGRAGGSGGNDKAPPARRPQETEEEKAARTKRVMSKLPKIAEGVPKMRAAVEEDLKRDGLSKARVGAVVAAIMDRTTMRVGSEEYATKSTRGEIQDGSKSQDSFGASSLRKQHVSIEGDTVKFSFPGKSRKNWEREITDPHLARAVKELVHTPGDRLMQYDDGKGGMKPFTETHARDYLAPHGLTPKNLRTYHATRMATQLFEGAPHPPDEKSAEATISKVATEVSKHLGNTPAIAKASYIDPSVITHFRSRIGMPANFPPPAPAHMSATDQTMPRWEMSDADFLEYLRQIQRAVESGALDIGEEWPAQDAVDDENGEPDGMNESAHFSLPVSSEAETSGEERIYRQALLFRAGEYPDKQFGMTEAEICAAAGAYDGSGLINFEHAPRILVGKLGRVLRLFTDDGGKTLKGEVAVPKWLDEQLSDKERQVSAEWDRTTKQFIGLALTPTPRVQGAALMAAFSAAHPDPAAPRSQEKHRMTLKERALAAIARFTGAVATAPDIDADSPEARAILAAAAGDIATAPAAVAPAAPPATFNESDEAKRLRAQVAALELRDTQRDAATFADAEIREKRALPRERAALIAQFVQAALDDTKSPAVVTFSATDGTAKTGTRVEALKAAQAARPTHQLLDEVIAQGGPNDGTVVVMSSTPSADTTERDEAERKRLLDMTDTGKRVLAGEK